MKKNTLLLALICILALLLRIPSLLFPLDYDVGGHLFYGMEVVKSGFYSTVQEIRPVGLLVIFAFIYKVVGSSTFWVNMIGACVWIYSTWIFYKVAELILNSKKIALVSTLFFVSFASSRAIQGEMANMETFFIPANLTAIYFYFFSQRNHVRYYAFIVGIFFGIAILIKQNAAFDFLAVILYIIFNESRKKNSLLKLKNLVMEISKEIGPMLLGIFLPILLVTLYFFLNNQINDFLYWNFWVIFKDTSPTRLTGSALNNLKNNFIPIFWKTSIFWSLSLLGLLSVIRKQTPWKIFILIWFFVDISGIYYLWWFFPHHFLQLTPALSILSGLFIFDFLEYFKKNYHFTKKIIKTTAIITILTIFIIFILSDAVYYTSYLKLIVGKIDKKTYLALQGFDIGHDGWLPLYETADYLKKTATGNKTIFIWGSLPHIYVYADKKPISYFVYKYPLLPQDLTTRTFKDWFLDYEKNRNRFLTELSTNIPDYFLVEVDPYNVFGEMVSFKELGWFINDNYFFNKKIGNVMIYKKKNNIAMLTFTKKKEPLIPIDIIKNYAVITAVEKSDNGTEIKFEPMVDREGKITSSTIYYPKAYKNDTKELTIKSFGESNFDYVGTAVLKPSGTKDLHIKLVVGKEEISFLRVKIGLAFWNNRSYGVNAVIKQIRNGGVMDLYFEPPREWKGKNINVYIIYENGSISTKDAVI